MQKRVADRASAARKCSRRTIAWVLSASCPRVGAEEIPGEEEARSSARRSPQSRRAPQGEARRETARSRPRASRPCTTVLCPRTLSSNLLVPFFFFFADNRGESCVSKRQIFGLLISLGLIIHLELLHQRNFAPFSEEHNVECY